MPPLTLTYSTDALRRLNEGGGGRAAATGAERGERAVTARSRRDASRSGALADGRGARITPPITHLA